MPRDSLQFRPESEFHFRDQWGNWCYALCHRCTWLRDTGALLDRLLDIQGELTRLRDLASQPMVLPAASVEQTQTEVAQLTRSIAVGAETVLRHTDQLIHSARAILGRRAPGAAP